MSGLTDAALVGRFEKALDQEEYGLKPGDGARLVQMAVNFSHAKCANDPKLGMGNDVRAEFALAEGITIGAMAMRDVFREAEKEAKPRPGHHPTPKGYGWVCHHCRFRCDTMEAAEEHILAPVTGEFTHWVYEHPDAFRGNPPTREMHSSDVGGVYLTPVEPEHAEGLTRRWRHGVGGLT